MAEQQPSAPARARRGVPPSPRAGVVHVRHRHTERFTVVGNHLAQHDALSLVAIGLAVYIQSKPDGALVGIKALAARFREGEVAIARALHELEAAGYLRRTVERRPDGRSSTSTVFHDCPEHLRERAADDAPAGAPAGAARPVAPVRQLPDVPPQPPQPTPPPEPTAAPAVADDVAEPPPSSPASLEAAGILASLRTHDSRLLLGGNDVTRLAPALTTWLERGVQPDAAVRTLTADLPSGLIRRPAGLLAYRLAEWLPPALPADLPGRTPPPPPRPHPFQTCEECDRAFRSPEPGLCRDCVEESLEAA